MTKIFFLYLGVFDAPVFAVVLFLFSSSFAPGNSRLYAVIVK